MNVAALLVFMFDSINCQLFMSFFPAGLENELDTWEDEVDEYLASAVFEHMQLNEDKV